MKRPERVAPRAPLLEPRDQLLEARRAPTLVTSGPRVVRTAYDAHIDRPSFCWRDGGTETVTVSYAKIASSNELWTIGGTSAPLLGFASSTLAHSGSPAPSSVVDVPVGTSMDFDHDGNLCPSRPRFAARERAALSVLTGTSRRTPGSAQRGPCRRSRCRVLAGFPNRYRR